MTKAELTRIFIVGEFGHCLNHDKAIQLGLIPKVDLTKILSLENAALTGAKMVLISKRHRQNANKLSKKIRYLELAANVEFNKEFIKALPLP